MIKNIKDKKGTTINNAFQKILNESNRKPNKIWVDKGSEFYNRSTKSFLQNNDIVMKENLFLLKDVLEPYKIKFINTSLQIQNTCMSINQMI